MQKRATSQSGPARMQKRRNHARTPAIRSHTALWRAAATIALAFGCAVVQPAAMAARVDPMTELDTIPAEEDEQGLWDIASGHENNLGNDGRLYRNRDLEAYLETISTRLVGDAIAHLDIEIDFIISRNNLLSAWVYPYGTIAVNTGLLASMENEAQLAAVLAHELSHFIQRHSYRELIVERRQGVLGKGLGFLATAAVAYKTGVVDTGLMKAGGFWTELATNGYSRKLEHVADAEGLELMRHAGYDIEQSVAAFRILGENAQYGIQDPALLWSSHPKLEDRIENLEKAVARAEKQKGYQPGAVSESQPYYEGVADALLINGRLDLDDRQFERARRSFRKYLQARPADPKGAFLIGESWRMQTVEDNWSARVEAYERAIAISPGFADAHRELGLTLRQQGQAEQARAMLNRYLEINPEAPDAGIIRGYLSAL